MEDKNDIGTISKEVPLHHVYPDDLRSYFVANLIVQHEPEYFVVSFFEVWPPTILGKTTEEKMASLQKVEGVDAKCVSRLIIAPEKMREFVQVMTENLKTYDRMMALKSKESEK